MTKFYLKTKPAITAVALSCLSYGSAQAHDSPLDHRHWNEPPIVLDLSPGPIVSTFCEGKYEGIAKELNRQNVLGQVNLYRAKSGLPFLKSQSFESRYRDYGSHTRDATRYRDSTLLLERAQSHLSPAAEVDYLRTLDLYTFRGQSLDWWLLEDQPDEERANRYCYTDLNPGNSWHQKPCDSLVKKTTETDTAVDWLMTSHQMENARTKWLGYGTLPEDQIDRIFQHIDTQSKLRPGMNIWMTQYANHTLFERDVPEEVTQKANAAVANILSCQASSADYGIIAAGDLGLPHEFLPKVLAEQRTRRDIHTLTYKAMRDGNGLDLNYRAQLQSSIDRLELKAWAAPFLFLSTPDVTSAIALYRETVEQEKTQFARYSQTRRASGMEHLLFSLPTEDIPDDYNRMRLAHALSEGKIALGQSLAAEVFAEARAGLETKITEKKSRLEASKGARQSYIDQVKFDLRKLETRYTDYKYENIQSADIPEALKLTLVAIYANASQNVDNHHRDIYPEQSNSDFLDIYLRRRLFPGSALNWRYRYSRSYLRISEPRLMGSESPGRAFQLPSLRRNDGTPEVGLAAIVDWDKLEKFGGEQRLTRVFTDNLFNWIDTASPQQRDKNAKLIAPALYDLIRICRHEDAGDFNGAPVQQRAFERLHKYFGETNSAKRTPYWWPSRPKHGNAPL